MWKENFCTRHIQNETSKDDKLMKVWYYAITTLSTIGYGDLTPITPEEKLLACVILICGVLVFSIIMAQFIEIMHGYKTLWDPGFRNKELDHWILLLCRFNNGKRLDPNLVTKIEDHMDFYWGSNRIEVIEGPSGQRFMPELPFSVREEIMFFLYSDFVSGYRTYLRPPPKCNRTRA